MVEPQLLTKKLVQTLFFIYLSVIQSVDLKSRQVRKNADFPFSSSVKVYPLFLWFPYSQLQHQQTERALGKQEKATSGMTEI